MRKSGYGDWAQILKTVLGVSRARTRPAATQALLTQAFVGATQCILISLAGLLCHRASGFNSNSQTNEVGKTLREHPVPTSKTRSPRAKSDPQTLCRATRGHLSFLFKTFAT